MKYTRLLFLICTIAGAAPMALAHEFWIEPLEFQVKSDTEFAAHLKNGQMFAGSAQPFFENRNTRLDVTSGAHTAPVTGRMGDRPAIRIPAPLPQGLMIVTHEAAPSVIAYKQWDKFAAFAEHKDFKEAAQIHSANGWPREGFKEIYTRHSKSLVAVGDGSGTDREMGLATEFVARDNPYAAGFDGTLDVTLLYGSVPRADAQIEVYARDAAGKVELRVLRTDAAGHAAIPVAAGMTYLLDAVVLRPATGPAPLEGAVWETLWASLTFAVPAP